MIIIHRTLMCDASLFLRFLYYKYEVFSEEYWAMVEKFVKLAEVRKKLEISVWVNRLEELKQKLDELEDIILLNKTEYENTEIKTDNFETDKSINTNNITTNNVTNEDASINIIEKNTLYIV